MIQARDENMDTCPECPSTQRTQLCSQRNSTKQPQWLVLGNIHPEAAVKQVETNSMRFM